MRGTVMRSRLRPDRRFFSSIRVARVAVIFVALNTAGPSGASGGLTLSDAYTIRAVGSLDASPDRALLAFEAEGGILVAELATKSIKRRLNGERPNWSPDGRYLAFFSRRAGPLQLYVWYVTQNVETQLTSLPEGIFPNTVAIAGFCDPLKTAWAPDSHQIAFASINQPIVRATSSETDIAIVYGASSPLSRSIVDGTFQAPNVWAAQMRRSPGDAALMKHIDLHPRHGRNQIHVVNLEDRSIRVLASESNEVCPEWSPKGEAIASITEIAEPGVNRDSYGNGFGRFHKGAITVFDSRAGTGRRLHSSFSRVKSVAWSTEGDRLIAMVEQSELFQSFTRLADISAVDGVSKLIQTPSGSAVKEIRPASDGSFLIKLAGRFVDTLWRLHLGGYNFKQVNTFDWQVQRGFGAFDQVSSSATAFWAETRGFKGRLILSFEERVEPQLMYDANPQTATFPLGEQRRVTWKNSQQEEVDGILILPPGYKSGERYPAVVDSYPRPAYDDFRVSAAIEDTGQLLAAEGYVVFRPAIRAPHGAYWFTRGEAYQEKARGAKGIPVMVDDFESGLHFLIGQGIVDPERIGVYGHSNGGWVANLLVTESKMIAAAVVSSGVSNFVMSSLWPYVKDTRGRDPASGGNVFDNLEEYVALSPIFKMREVNIPMLLMVGDDDWSWVPQMISQYGVLRSEGKNVTLVRYPREAHSIRGRQAVLDAKRRISAFFGQHLRPTTQSAK
jgi:dipeptidyl aminopeptidase/acylaminoacyl peptidase